MNPRPKPPPRAPTSQTIAYPWNAAQAVRLEHALRHGEVIAYPTESIYALGGNALLPQVASAIYALKGRSQSKPLLLIVSGIAQAEALAPKPHPLARALMERFWPGPLTLVLPPGAHTPPHLYRDGPRGAGVALRWCAQEAVADLHALYDVPLIGTSANRSGSGDCYRARDVLKSFPRGLMLVVERDAATPRAPSTVLEALRPPFRILREGAIPAEAIAEVAPLETVRS